MMENVKYDAGQVWGDPTRMAGTEETFDYLVIGHGRKYRFGVRVFDSKTPRFRIRLEVKGTPPTLLAELLTRDAGWKQPGDSGQPRFSAVSDSFADVAEVVDWIEDLLTALDPTYEVVCELTLVVTEVYAITC